MKIINSFSGEHAFLSNFHPATVEFDGVIYPNVENAFQAAKTLDPEQRKAFVGVTPGKAKRMGRMVNLRPDWERVKVSVMMNLLKSKFSRDPELRTKLIATAPAELVEGNTWGDVFWGQVLTDGKWVGKNQLGIALMFLRGALMDGAFQ